MVDQKEKKVSLLGSVGFIVGCIIGAGIFVMTGPLAGEIGPGLYIAYILALIPAIGEGLAFAQVGSAIQTTAGYYSYLSMFYHQIVGFVYAWVLLFTDAAILSLLAEGFAEYFCAFFPSFNPMIAAFAVLILCYVLHMIGIKSAELAQSLMVIFMLGALAIFVFGGIPAIKPELGHPLFPTGFKPIIASAASLFFAYLGFATVTDIGEEIKNPGKTIPLSIIISAVIVGLLYVGTSFVLPRVIPYKELASTGASLAEAASIFLPSWGRGMMLWAATLAIVTTVNASFLINSRAWYAMARDGFLPKILTKTNSKGAPYVALSCSLVGGIIILLSKWGIVYCGTMASINALLATALIAYAPLILLKKDKFKEAYEKAPFKMPRKLLWPMAIITSAMCIILTIAGFLEFPSILFAFVVWLIPGMIIYNVRKKASNRYTVEIEEKETQ